MGRWNPAILTPAGIARHVFGLEVKEGLPLEVRVPLDGLSPYLVKHPEYDLVARLDERRLRLETRSADYETLGVAMRAGKHAITDLRVTPLTAAGVNVDFHSDDAAGALTQVLSAEIDGPLSDLGYRMNSRGRRWALAWEEGLINVTVDGGADKGYDVSFNFHLASSEVPELVRWLERDTGDIRSNVDLLLQALDLQIEEEHDANTD